MPAIKTPCPVTRQDFRSKARQALTVTIDKQAVLAQAKEFSTGSLGWFHNGKCVLDVGGVAVSCQVQVQVTIVNSKDLPK